MKLKPSLGAWDSAVIVSQGRPESTNLGTGFDRI